MPRMRALAGIVAGIGLVFVVAVPAAAEDPPPTETITIQVQVTGYVPSDNYESPTGTISCVGLPDPIWWQVELTAGSGETTVEVPAGVGCAISDVWMGDPGDLAYWGDLQIDQPAPTTYSITIERWYDGSDPPTDAGVAIGLETFTVDRVYLNRYGGVTAEGSIRCAGLADFYGYQGLGEPPALGVDWKATQYVGRKTAIVGYHWSDIASFCYDPDHPTEPVTWRSYHPSGDGVVTAWVYGENGKFASGTIRIDAVVGAEFQRVTQWWNPDLAEYDATCSTTPTDDGLYDANGDGFCVVDGFIGQRTTANLKAIRVR